MSKKSKRSLQDVVGKETYEVWEKVNKRELRGRSYQIKDGVEVTTEQLTIQSTGEAIVYTAIVSNQNEGKPIAFRLNEDAMPDFSFENPDHDFPTKIIYSKINDMSIRVRVQGPDGKGFTLTFTRQ